MTNLATYLSPERLQEHYAPYGWDHHASGHTKGSALVSDHHPIAYLNIPKCGSTSLKAALGEVGFHYDDSGEYVLPPDHKAFAVIREPTARFVSALGQYYANLGHDDVPAAVQAELDRVAADGQVVAHDVHLFPQTSFLDERVPLEGILCLEGGLEQARALLEEWGCPIASPERRNARPLDCVVPDDAHEAIRAFYHLDYVMYGLVKNGLATCWRPQEA